MNGESFLKHRKQAMNFEHFIADNMPKIFDKVEVNCIISSKSYKLQ